MTTREGYLSPLTENQKGIYFETLFERDMEGAVSNYNLAAASIIRGSFDIDVFEDAFRILINRHGVLRLSFQLENGIPVQLLHDEAEFHVGYLDLTGRNKREADDIIARELDDNFTASFDLTKAPLMRARILKKADGEYLFLTSIHHLIADGWSTQILFTELFHVYTRLRQGRTADLPNLDIDFIDYAQWQNAKLAKGEFDEERAYWLGNLEGSRLLKLMTDYPFVNRRMGAGREIRTEIERNLTASLKDRARGQSTTLFTLLLSAFKVLLFKYTKETDIIVSSPFADRPFSELENTMGLFLNDLPLRDRLDGGIRFSELIESVKSTIAGAYKNVSYPASLLVKDMGWSKAIENTAYTDICFGLDMLTSDTLVIDDESEFTLQAFDHNAITMPSALMLFFIEKGDKISIALQYNNALFRHETVSRMFGHYLAILDQIAANADRVIHDIDILGAAEREQILHQFNNTKADYAKDKTFSALFEEQVTRTPDNIAVVCGDKSLTYRELNIQANRLARLLREKGVGPDMAVGIMVERSLEMMVGIYGILKAGGAYLPISPAYPQERGSYMLEDSRAGVLLTMRKYIRDDMTASRICVIDLTDEDVYRRDGANLEPVNQPTDLMYIIYTSGSTGKPKGAMIEHHSAINRIQWMHKAYPISEDDAILQKTPYTFDVSVWELFWWAMVGARVVMLKPDGEKDPRDILESIEHNRINVLHFVPSMLNAFLEYLEGETHFRERLASLKYVFCSGEALQVHQRDKFHRLIGKDIRLINLYGPTEATVDVSYYNCDESFHDGIVPIGKPIDNIELLIVNERMTLQPIGIPGELCISGVGLARGYINQPELTAEKFVAHPYEAGARMYRTGDLARWLPDGNIEFLGRIDSQVKIRGFRIELGEIESRLLQCEGVKEAVVVDKDDASGNKYLCAYYTGESDIPAGALREHLASALPDYMVPPYFMRLEKIPLTPNGKIDRRALPEPSGNLTSDTAYEAPQNETEAALVGIWQDLLGAEKIGVADNFFERGGHSLKAITLISRIGKAFNINISIADIFRNPTIKAIAAHILASEKTQYPSIPPLGKQAFYATSSAQKRLYALQQFDVDGIGYNMPGAIEIEGDLDLSRLEEAIKHLIARHESLRTSFDVSGEDVIQIVHDHVDFALQYVQASNQDVKSIIRDFIQPFNLHQAPLLRAMLIKKEDKSHILLFDMHHIISDGMSMSIVMKEFAQTYEGKTLHEIKIQYKDFAAWQNDLFQSGRIKSQADYWIKQFGDEIPVLNLQTDYPRPQVQSYAGSRKTFRITKETADTLKALGEENGATLYMTLLALYNILLYKYTGQDDIVVGSAIAGRRQSVLENIVGMFVNTLALRSRPAGEKTFKEFLKEVRQTALDAYENQDYPFDMLVEQLNIKRDLGRNPVFDVMFVLQNIDGLDTSHLQLKNAKVKPYEPENNISKFDLSFILNETEAGIDLEIEYSTKLFQPETIERLGGHYLNLLEDASRNPQKNIADMEMLSSDERSRILNDFNATAMAYPKDKTITELFEEQAAKTPDNIALVDKDQTLTYRQLNEKANRLAHALRNKGVKPDRVVGLMVERSAEMVIGMLGILKAGGAYLPIDPDYPAARIRFMLENSRAEIVLTQTNYKNNIQNKIEFIDLDDDFNDQYSLENPERVNDSSHLAYVIYTSGSTGNPKGVMVEHRGLVNLVGCRWKMFQENEKSRLTQVASPGFDAMAFEIWSGLTAGAAIYIVPENTRMNPDAMKEYIIRNGITHSYQSTAIAELLLKEAWPDDIALRSLQTAGDRLREFPAHTYPFSFYNLYGPTEDTVWTTACEVGEDRCGLAHPGIGKPIANHGVYILGRNLTLQPIGIPGELCIAGVGLARGYINQPELTAEKFVAHPYEAGARMYRTGDLARWLPDGNIEFLGRIDSQVKIRGFRIELGEIESRLLQCEGVKEAVVVDKDDASGNKYLCAYYTGESDIPAGVLREHLTSALPDYMAPPYFVRLEKIPLTPNGKIDRRALPEPSGNLTSDTAYEAPQNETEAALVGIWQELLGAEKIGVNDNFFELGGHSLKAITLISRIGKTFNATISIADIFRNPTIRAIAAHIAGSEKTLYPSITVLGKQDVYETSSAQKRIYALQQFDVAGIGYNMPGAIEIEGELDQARLEEAIKHLIARHESLRTSFDISGEDVIQIVHDHVDFALQYVQADAQNVKSIIHDFIQPFNLHQAPLLRAMLIGKEDKSHILLFDMHHIISDGMSMSIVMKEFAQSYEGKTLNEIKIQYKDFAAWQNDLFRSGKIKSQEDYWSKQFGDEIPVLNLQTDYPRPPVQSYAGSRKTFRITKETAIKLKALGEENGATLYMTLLALCNVLLYKYTGQDDIVVGSAIAGRRQSALEQIVGMFVNTLALRSRPSGEKTFIELLKEVQQTALDAYENQDYPFDLLVEKLNIKRDLGRNPVFDVMFVLQNIDGLDTSHLQLKNAKVKLYEPENNISKFDLSFILNETETGIDLEIEYSTKLFKPETIERLGQHYLNIIEDAGQNPQKQLSQIEMLSEAEKRQLLHDFNATEMDYPRDKTITELFEEQAAKTPDNIALVYENEKLTYRQLNEKANRLARALRNKGVKPDMVVGLMVDRSAEMVIGMLGILKAGGAYLPIDPDYPAARIRFMLENSRANIVLTRTKYKSICQNEIECINLNDEITDPSDSENPRQINNSRHLAYVIYTSGSTGNPKGVMIEHRSLVNFIFCFSEKMNGNIGPADHFISLTNMTFDVSVCEIFVPIVFGARLTILDKDIVLNVAVLAEFMASRNVTFSYIPPALLAEVCNHLAHLKKQHAPVVLNKMLVGVEPIKDHVLEEYLKINGEMRIVNGYGPTESTICATFYPYVPGKVEGKNVPIGKPLANNKIIILGRHDQVLPVGVAGELCISGDNLARGYAASESLTDEKFVANPFVSGARMYRTGDLARFLPDGNIEFLGRIDSQVKIRGFRIELGEIESRLLSYAGLKELVVIDRQDGEGNKYLCAYYVSGVDLPVENLRRHLAENLPDYMIPSYFIRIEKIPLTPNGKIDRRALPEPSGNITTGAVYEAPRNDVEETLLRVWQDVLGASRAGINDNFFALGGDSIKTIQIVSRLKKSGIKLDIRDIFLHPTIKDLTRYVKKDDRTSFQGIVAGDLPLTPIQRWFFEQNLKDPHHFNQSVLLHAKGRLNENLLRAVFDKLVEHHDALRLSFIYCLTIRQYNRNLTGNLYDLSVIDHKKEQDAAALIEQKSNDFQSSLNIVKGPLMKACLFQTNSGDHLLVVIHHLAVDGVSWRILLEDLTTGYDQAAKGENITLPPKTDSYKMWAENLSDYAPNEHIKEELAYWQGIKTSSRLPKDQDATPEEKIYQNAETVEITFDESTTGKLLKESNRAYNTEINDLLLTALGITVSGWTKSKTILINLEGHGREQIGQALDITRTIGWFTCQYPVAIDINQDDDLSTQIKQTKEQLRRIPQKGIGYGILKYLTKEGRDKLHVEPEISFNYLGEFGQTHKGTFALSPIKTGRDQSPQNCMPYALDINGYVEEGRLTVHFGYNRKEYYRETISNLASDYKVKLEAVIGHCLQKEEVELTPADLGYKDITLDELGELENDLMDVS